ncbi:MAG: hypothetical protein Q8O05_06625 [Chloroflexota bacterium]|nr:hypothetical protein [Chloroflexota bacterium]
MINKRKILGVVVTLSLLASFVVAAVPASAGTLGWTTFTPPSTSNNVLTTDVITDIAVAGDGKTIFAGTGGLTLYKSTDKGVGWSKIMTSSTSNNGTSDFVAVAPDDSNYIVIADATSGNITVTTNGGTTWYRLGPPETSATIKGLDFSPALSGVHYIGVVGAVGAAAGVWYFDVGAAAPTWKAITGGIYTGFTTGTSAGAVAFSPAFASDQVMATVTDNGTILLQLFSFNSKKWNGDAGFSGYPGTIVATGGPGITAASITLDPGYLGSDDSTRLAFIGLTVTGDPDKNGIWRMSDTTAKDLKIGAAVQMQSVAWNGSVLVGGRYDSNIIYYSSDATASSPTVSTTTSYKRPGLDTTGNEKTVVAWAGADVVAGVQNANGAFAVSRNNAKSFNDISLINTTLTSMRDVGISADGAKVFLVTDDGTYTSVWRKTTAWERVFTVADIGPTGALGYFIRLAPD